MRTIFTTLILGLLLLTPQSVQAASAAGALAKGLKPSDATSLLQVRHIKRGASGYRTTSDRYMRKYFFPPYQWRATRCSYRSYRRNYVGKRYTYRCWRRKGKYLSRHRRHW